MGGVLKYLSSHFIEFFCANIVFLIIMVTVYTTIKVRFLSIRTTFLRILRISIFTFIVTIEVFWFAFCGYMYWVNYQTPALKFQLTDEVIATTGWVEDQREIFMIHGDELLSIQANGKNRQMVFKAHDLIKEYYFSPDNKYILIATITKLYLLNRESSTKEVIASITSDVSTDEKIRGVISGISWSPDSKKFTYEVSRWSRVSSQDRVYIYDLSQKKKRSIETPARKVSSLIWGMDAESLYYLKSESKDTSEHAYAFMIHVFKMTLDELKPKLLTQIPSEEANIPVNNLRVRGINLFLEGDQLSFGRGPTEKIQKSENEAFIGINERDFLYYVPPKGWPDKLLFKVKRTEDYDHPNLNDYTGGNLDIDQLRWLPGGRYVIMKHRYWGVLIMDPIELKVGQLIEIEGEAFGWFKQLKN